MTLTSEDFLLAAKRAEISTLKQLLVSSGLVTWVTDLIHELQRERGLSNIYLVSHGQRFARQRLDELEATKQAECVFREALSLLELDSDSPSSARLFRSLSFVLHCLDELPALRLQINAQKLTADENTRLFNRTISGLLSVVFEAAGSVSDPDITHALVAMFNFVQGKEYSGQERALGVIGFAMGEFTKKQQIHIKTLQDAQQRCFDIFSSQAKVMPVDQWRQAESSEAAIEFNKLRNMIARFSHNDTLPTAISEVWYELSTHRIDDMRAIEKELEADLFHLCQQKIAKAEEDLRLHDNHVRELTDIDEPPTSVLSSFPDSINDPVKLTMTPGFNTNVASSISELVQRQAEHLEAMRDELRQARQALDERKLIEKAKGLLMQNQNINEEEAYRQIRQSAMDNKKRIIDIVRNIISVSDMLQLNDGDSTSLE
ncbi:nitrate- and nitrite sensing domain-containing protein [Oceanobacter sp. 5_MG-2023]|uniref:nitrate regulatory protein n=1 Tax=Oceanobacter sp. 5_MG-2023 TaxID=3062645 RepID=UPI0026E456E4|nr:nitrate regulatory protein [Oceanobacter sp. 5_MG-2023]MDO6681679.1 nitrate- and nitrite sensing domain-containing protein [Oceanobacter sp. 5_MG-2023]